MTKKSKTTTQKNVPDKRDTGELGKPKHKSEYSAWQPDKDGTYGNELVDNIPDAKDPSKGYEVIK